MSNDLKSDEHHGIQQSLTFPGTFWCHKLEFCVGVDTIYVNSLPKPAVN